MDNIIIITILVVLVGSVLWYFRRMKKRGEKCIGCPYAKQCSGKCSGIYDNVEENSKKG